MINNFKHIAPLLEFRSEDEFYYLQILQRKKDNADSKLRLGKNNNARTISNYFIRSTEHLASLEREIVGLCNYFTARASIRLNRRSFKNTAYRNLQKVAGIMANGEFNHVKTAYSKACGTGNIEPVKKWIIDIDEEDMRNYLEIKNKIVSLQSDVNDEKSRTYKIVAELPSRTGMHLITNPFRVDVFKKDFPEIDVQKDNPTNLYIPNIKKYLHQPLH